MTRCVLFFRRTLVEGLSQPQYHVFRQRYRSLESFSMATQNTSPAPRKAEERYLLVIDLDGAMLSDPTANARLATFWHACSDARCLIYTSGMFYDSVVQAVLQLGLPEPAAIVGGVGTEIRLHPSGEPCIQWQSRWWSTWQIDRVRQVLDQQSVLQLQPAERQSEFKRSYFVSNAAPQWLQETRWLLKQSELAAELVYSSNRNLDIVPSGASKGAAVEYLARNWKIARNRVIVAGDCESAISMYLLGYRGIITASAPAELFNLNGPNIFRSKLSLADAVVDGLQHWTRNDLSSLGGPSGPFPISGEPEVLRNGSPASL